MNAGAAILATGLSKRFGAGLELFGRVLPIGLEMLVTTVFALVFLVLAIGGFARTD